MFRFVLAVVVLAALVGARASAEVPKILRVRPIAIAPGKATHVTIDASGFGDENKAATLWTSFPTANSAANVEREGQESKKAYFRVEPAAGVLPEIYGIRTATSGGVSNLRLLMIDDLPTIRQEETNIRPAEAQPIEFPVAIEGSCEAESFQYFTLHAEAGRQLSFEVVARRLGSPLDAVLRLFDEKGHELAYCDDDEAIGADPRFRYHFERDGEYRLELRDIRYQGGSGHFYRLRVGDFPLLAAPFPMGVVKGKKTVIEPTGLGLEKAEPITIEVPADYDQPQYPFVVRNAKGQGSGFASVLVGPGPEQVEQEPNDAADAATPLSLVGAMNGRFAVAGDRDEYRFAAKKGHKLRFAATTKELGSPTDLYLRLFDASGEKPLAESDETRLDEGILEVKIPADGEYLLRAQDLVGRGGPHFTYRIEVVANLPLPTARLDAEKYDVPSGGTVEAKVVVDRDGTEGPVRFRVEGAAGVEARGEIEADKNEVTIKFFVPPTYELGTLLNVRLIAEMGEGKKSSSVRVSTTAALRKSLGGLPACPPSLEDVVAIGVVPAKDDAGSKKSARAKPQADCDAEEGAAIEEVSFKNDIAPILVARCLACHGAAEPKGDYRLDSFAKLGLPGASGAEPVVAGKPDESELLRLVASTDPDERMPKEADPLSDEEVALVRRWLSAGAKYDAKDPATELVRIVPRKPHPKPPASYTSAMPVTALAFTPSGDELAVGGYYEITVWNPTDGKLLRRIQDVEQRVFGLAYTSDGKLLAAAGGTPGISGEAALYDPAKKKLVRRLGTMSDVALSVAFAPDGKRLAVAAADRSIRIYDVASGKQSRLIEDHADWVTSIAWNAAGTQLVSASRDRMVKVFDAATGESLTTFPGHDNLVYGATFTPDGKAVLSCGADQRAILWQVDDAKQLATLTGFGGPVYRVELLDGDFWGCSSSSFVGRFNLDERKRTVEYRGHSAPVVGLAVSRSAKLLATGDLDGEVRIWNLDNGKNVVTFRAKP